MRLLLFTLTAASALAQVTSPVLGSGARFYASYPSIYGACSPPTCPAGNAAGFVNYFAGWKVNPSQRAYAGDPRVSNPNGAYFTHFNMLTIASDNTGASGHQVEGRVSYSDIHTAHEDWLVKNAAGNPQPLTPGGADEVMNIANTDYQDFLISWLKNTLFDATDKTRARTYWQHDNGYFLALSLNCAVGDVSCTQYNTDAGVQSAWVGLLGRVKAAYPKMRIIINNGAWGQGRTMADTLTALKTVMAQADGIMQEYLTDRNSNFAAESASRKRELLKGTMEFFRWLAVNDKDSFVSVGQDTTTTPSQADLDYHWAFFNLMRRGERQYFARFESDYVPRIYPEMTKAIGTEVDLDPVEFSTNVFKREFSNAIAYVNMSDSTVSITLPAGTWTNAAGVTVTSPLSLTSFSGKTVYR